MRCHGLADGDLLSSPSEALSPVMIGCRGGADPGASAAFTIGGKAGGACESDVRDARSPSCTDQRTLEEDAEADEEVEYRVPSEVAPADNGDATDGGRADGWVRRGCINSGGGAGIDG